jgi:hypothetical protein
MDLHHHAATAAAIIVALIVRAVLKPGANIAINGAVRKPDGSLEASRANVGRGDIVPN